MGKSTTSVYCYDPVFQSCFLSVRAKRIKGLDPALISDIVRKIELCVNRKKWGRL